MHHPSLAARSEASNRHGKPQEKRSHKAAVNHQMSEGGEDKGIFGGDYTAPNSNGSRIYNQIRAVA